MKIERKDQEFTTFGDLEPGDVFTFKTYYRDAPRVKDNRGGYVILDSGEHVRPDLASDDEKVRVLDATLVIEG